MNTINVELGKRIRKIRIIKHYSVYQLAQLSNISSKFLFDLEHGMGGISVHNLLMISKSLSVSVDYLFTGLINEERMEEIVYLIEKDVKASCSFIQLINFILDIIDKKTNF